MCLGSCDAAGDHLTVWWGEGSLLPCCKDPRVMRGVKRVEKTSGGRLGADREGKRGEGSEGVKGSLKEQELEA